jgi:hypothetical protein
MPFDLLQTVVSLGSGVVGAMSTYQLQERKLRKEYQLQDRTERVARKLLSNRKWTLRSFQGHSTPPGRIRR